MANREYSLLAKHQRIMVPKWQWLEFMELHLERLQGEKDFGFDVDLELAATKDIVEQLKSELNVDN